MMLNRFWKAIAASCLLACISAVGADAQYFGRNKIQYTNYEWQVLSTPHFDIHYYKGAEAFAVRAGLVLEDGYGMLSGKLKEVLPWKVPVILYSNHSDFLQTNVTPELLSEGVQAFAEPSRRRIVLPFTASFKDFSHTAIHELAHVFTFQIVYNRMLDNVFTRNYLFPMPLWVAEGLAEYLSVGWDADSDMFIRDAVIHDYLVPFYGVGGFYVYKEGQSLFNYIAETYGHQKVLEMLDALAGTRSASAALQRTIGLTEQELYEDWSKSLRKHYWPLYPNKTEVSDIGRRLTNHIKDHGYYNTKPILSPDGEKIVFFSDRSGFVEIFVMSALDGEILAKVVTGAKSNRFESLHLLTSSMCFDPRGGRVAFIAKSKGHDALFIKNIDTGEETKYEIESNGLTAPAWSPVKNEIVLSATFHGQTDLMLVDLDTGESKRLTDDPADQLTPRWFPDGNRVVFVHYPEVTAEVPENFRGHNRDVLSEMDFLDPTNVRHDATYDIYEYNIPEGRQRALVTSPGDDTEPVILSDGKTIIYASDVSGVNNLHSGNIETGEYYRFTDVLGGLFTPSVHEKKNRVAFSAFVKGGWDVYVSDDLSSMLGRRYTDESPGVLAYKPDTAAEDMGLTRVTLVRPDDSAQPAADAAAVAVDIVGPPAPPADAAADTTRANDLTAPVDIATYSPAIVPLTPPGGKDDASNGKSEKSHTEGITDEIPGEDTPFKGATVTPYKTRLAPDFIGQGGGLYFSTGFGFGISNAIAMSDILGDHHLGFAFNIYGNLEDSDFLLTYSYLKRRIDYSVGVFQFKSYFDSRVTSLGESLANYTLFSERNYGMFGLASVPFNKFYRMDLELQAYISDRQFFERTTRFGAAPVDASTRRLIEPSVGFVHDSSFYGPFGPVEGSRWRISASRSLAFDSKSVSRTTGFVDYRWYKRLFYRNSFAFRILGAGSTGQDPRVFFLGGPTTLRGYDYLQFEGTKMGMFSLEYRFPLVDALIFGWPGRWGFTNIGGSAFFDAGSAWDDYNPDFIKDNRFEDIYADAGFGVFMYAGYFLLNFQFAWPTDGRTFDQGSQFHFYLGPTF